MIKKATYTKALGARVASAARPESAGNYHVIATTLSDKWTVVPKGSVHAVKAFTTQKEAILFAKQSASKKNGEVVVHSKRGMVKSKISFAKK